MTGRIKSGRTLRIGIDHRATAPSRLHSRHDCRSSPNAYPWKAAALLGCLTSGPRALMLPWCIRCPTVIAHWHLGNRKCFFWVWVTPYAEEGGPLVSATLFFFCEPGCDMWYVAPCWGWKHSPGWLMLQHFGNSTGLSHWTVNRQPAFRGGHWAPAEGPCQMKREKDASPQSCNNYHLFYVAGFIWRNHMK